MTKPTVCRECGYQPCLRQCPLSIQSAMKTATERAAMTKTTKKDKCLMGCGEDALPGELYCAICGCVRWPTTEKPR